MPYAPSALLAGRHARLRAALNDLHLDALLITHLPNVFYLTNFVGSAAAVVVTADRFYFVTDFRYVAAFDASSKLPSACPDSILVRVDGSYDSTLAALIRSLPVVVVGFEAAHMPVSRFRGLSAALGCDAGVGRQGGAEAACGVRLVATERLIEQARLRKDDHELQVLRAAGSLLSEVVVEVTRELRAGRSEREVAAIVDWMVKRAGFDRPAFDTIVASGPNAALPHARPGDRPLAPGDLILLDFGGVYDGYCVDISRTVSLGTAGAEARSMYAAVLAAQAASIAAVRPGVAPSLIDRAARETLDRHGLGDAFGHATGHGLGIEVHEEPRIGPVRPDQGRPGASTDALRGNDRDTATGGTLRTDLLPAPGDGPVAEGMVFTIEPGAYRPGWGGVRIEDDVVVCADGCELLTTASRELIEL
jgi:Xaa-Pro aminopeptidase